MAEYKYTAITSDNKQVRGRKEAGGAQELLKLLAAEGLHCLEFDEIMQKGEPRTVYKMKTREIVILCRQLETMLGAGVTISRVFQILHERATQPRMGKLYGNIYESIQKGNPLSEAMRDQGRSFPSFLIHMIASGEASGTLDQVTKRMTTHFNNQMKLSNKIKNAMIYPIVLLVVSIAVIILLFVFVLPRLFSMFEGADIPASTKFLIWFSNTLVNYWPYILAGIAGLAFLIAGLLQVYSIRLFVDTAKMRIPKIGKLFRVIYTAQFANSMATLYGSGIPIMKALEISCQILGNTYYTKNFTAIIEKVGGGQSLAESAEETDLFDSMFLSLIFIGEESGTLEKVLEQAAEYYDIEAQGALERLVAMLEPVMITALAIVIGFIVVSVIVPMYTMYQTI